MGHRGHKSPPGPKRTTGETTATVTAPRHPVHMTRAELEAVMALPSHFQCVTRPHDNEVTLILARGPTVTELPIALALLARAKAAR